MIINVYKPRNWTSNDVVQKIKHGCNFKKVGHAGTLDPLAKGVLLVLTDDDTKKFDEIAGLTKEYKVTIAFGYDSDSHDLGTPLREFNKNTADNLTKDRLETVLCKYLGRIRQRVPLYSAVHVKGHRLYKMARSERFSMQDLPYKEVEIYDLKIYSFKKNEAFVYPDVVASPIANCTLAELWLKCGKGTYIRALVRDVGEDLGCGAVAVSLIRSAVGSYRLEESVSIEKVLASFSKS